MEAATVARQVPAEPEPMHDGLAEATKSTEELFQWSTHVHVGLHADVCEHAADGACEDARHFHCWLCLPNTFQARDIQDKAFAAKARKRRALLDIGGEGRDASDAHYILEDQIAAWGLTEETLQALRMTIADRRVRLEYSDITRALSGLDEFEHYAADLEELRRLANVPEGERDGEEFERLEAELERYRVEFEKRATARYDRELQILGHAARDEVLEIERRFQVDEQASEQFLHTYYTWAYYSCARVPVAEGYPSERAFRTPEALRNCAPEVLDALRSAYRRLESRLIVRGDAAGN